MAESPESLGPSPPEEVQAYASERFAHRREALERVRQALEKDPGCPDALRMEILLEARPPREKALKLKALAGQMETDGTSGPPFLRVLLDLARTLEQCNKGKEAVPIYDRALRLAPGDPLEIRHHLARCLLDLRRLKELKELRERYPEKTNALTAWIRLLEIQKSEKQLGLEQALQEARRANPHVEDFLTSRRRIPRSHDGRGIALPGSVEEALHVLDMIGEAWFSDRTALSWIIKQKQSD